LAQFYRLAAEKPGEAGYQVARASILMYDKRDLEGALVACRRALAIDPRSTSAHLVLGVILADKKDLRGAAAAFRRATEIDPQNWQAQNNLGFVLNARGDLEGAAAAFRRAADLNPRYVYAHHNLADVLRNLGDLEEAVAEFRRAVAIDPAFPLAHAALGQALVEQGLYAEARDATRRALALLPRDSPARAAVLGQLQKCEALLGMEKKLAAVLQGREGPAAPSEAALLAWMCARAGKDRDAVRLYADAFRADPRLAAVLQRGFRIDAARSALLAAGRALPAEDVVRLRGLALDWLRADLAVWADLLDRRGEPVRPAARSTLRHWQRHRDFMGVRHPWALLRLPADERRAWKRLWADVVVLLQKAGGDET
jgi:tetratricopeptide (TPR) repeat protein